MISYQWTSSVIALAIAGAIIWFVRNHRLHAGKAMSWICLAVIIGVAGVAPGLVDSIAVYLGVHYPPLLAVLAALAVILFKLLRIDIERSEDRRQIRLLARKLTILECRYESDKKKQL